MDSSRFPVVTSANAARLKRVGTLRPHVEMTAHDFRVAFDPGGTRVASMEAAGMWACWWSLEAGHAGATAPREPLELGGPCCLLPDADHAVCVGRANLSPEGAWRPRLMLLSARDGVSSKQVHLPHAVKALARSREGRLLAVMMDEGEVLLWDVQAWRLVRALEGLPGTPGFPAEAVVSRCAFSPDGRYLAAVSTRWSDTGSQGLVWLWEVATGGGPWCVPLETHVSHGLAFHPTRPWLVVSGGTNYAALVDVEARRLLRRLPGFYGYGCHLDFDASGALVLVSSDGFGFCLRDLETGETRFEVQQEGNVSDACFSPDGRCIALGEWGGGVSLWAVVD
ncbi:hypothetical protein LZ198_32480 [Myxococcus sp. K15C18031901]|uniref:WD40 repeat domain-containing protein n=1 Tax=Myxococcus dinghuensis TaxID=2906761 RepID=UPI0020A7F534|nr:hypothetical protein [Myxococcus dinghuensis]MCP3103611.1 hypothetical protein [Myxococcus dinghuensis]